jgi:hypothetical protein
MLLHVFFKRVGEIVVANATSIATARAKAAERQRTSPEGDLIFLSIVMTIFFAALLCFGSHQIKQTAA